MLRGLTNCFLRPYLGAAELYTDGSAATQAIGGQDYASSTRSAAGQSTLVFDGAHKLQRALIRVGCAAQGAGAGSFPYDTSPSTTTGHIIKLVDAAGTAADSYSNLIWMGWATDDDRRIKPPQSVKHYAKSPRVLCGYVASDGTTVASWFSSTKSATGVYDITFRPAFGRIPVCVASPIAATAAQKSVLVYSTTASATQIKTYNSSEAAEDCGFYIIVVGWDATDEQTGMDRVVQMPFRGPRIVAGYFTVSGTTPTAVSCDEDYTVEYAGATGKWTITFTEAFSAEPVVITMGHTAAVRSQLFGSATTSDCVLQTFGATGSVANAGAAFIAVGPDLTVNPVDNESGT